MEVTNKSGIEPFLKLLTLLTLILSLVITGLTTITPVRAADGIVVHNSPNVQGYHITVLAEPNPITVGKVSFLVRLAAAGDGNRELPVRGANMLVEFYHLSGPGVDNSSSYIQRRNLEAPETEPGNYEVSDSLQNEGVYRITLKISDGAKNFQDEFNITALPPPEDRFISVLLISLFPIFLAWLVWMYLKKPGQPSSVTSPEEGTASDNPAEAAGEARR